MLFLLALIVIPLQSFAEEIKIKIEESVSYEDLNLIVYDVEDSRCPLDVTCVWEGKVSARIQASNQTHKMGAPLEIGFPFTYITPYTITLIDVTPHPISTEKPDYTAILEITKLPELEEPEPPLISDEQQQMIQEYCETGIRHPDMIVIPQCIKNDLVCGPGSELVDGICHVIKYEKSDHMTPSIFLDGFFFMIFVSPFFIPSAIIFIVLSKTPRYDKKIRLVVCIPAIIVVLYFLWGLLVGWYPLGYA